VITTNDLGSYGYTVAQGGYYTFFARVTTGVQISASDVEARGEVSEAWDITEVRVSV
jgi:hypothetical protein